MKELSPDKSQQQQVLDSVLGAHAFRAEKATRSREILQFLFKQGDGGARAVDIAREVYGRERDWKTAGRAINALKGMLDRHYEEGEGRSHEIRLQVKSGPGYRLIFGINNPSAGDAVERFWRPYLADAVIPNIIVFAEPIFFRDDNRSYIRNLDCNDPDERWRLWDLVGRDKAAELLVSYHYLSAGELLAVLNLNREFQRRKVFLDFGTTKTYPAWASLSDKNVILVGSSRSNPHIAKLQEGEPLRVSDVGVQATLPDGTSKDYIDGFEALPLVDRESRRAEVEKLSYLHWQKHGLSSEQNWYWAEKEYDRRLLDSMPLSQFFKYVVVTRRPGTHEGKTITMIAANHGRAAQGVANYLTESQNVQIILADVMKVGVDGVPPAHFQVLFEVEMTKERGDVEAKHIEAIRSWPGALLSKLASA